MISLQQYLEYSKEQVVDILCHAGVHFVIGNESCDLDSMVSSITLAYFYHLTKYKSGLTKVIPVMNVSSSDFQARTLNKHELAKYKIPIESLIFKENIDFAQVVENKGVKVTLVDHHVLADDLSLLKSCVVGIFDHRPVDESEVWPENVKVNIQPVGSCATLIAKQYFVLLGKCVCIEHKVPLRLMLDAIVFDTIGLNPMAKKVTEDDKEMCHKIEEVTNEAYVAGDVFRELSDAHNDISKLTTAQILVKDLKTVGNVCIPGLPMLVGTFLKRNDVKAALQDFYKERKAKLVVLMGIDTSNEVQRDLAVYATDKQNQLVETVKELLLKSDLGLVEAPCNVSHVVYFKQNNMAASRKQVIPIIKESIGV